MKEREQGFIIGSITSTLGTFVFIMCIFTLWLTENGKKYGQIMCDNVTSPIVNCHDLFLQGKIIFSFILPFFIFMPVGLIIARSTRTQGKWVCKRKWVISTASLAVLLIGLFVIVYRDLPDWLMIAIGVIMSGAVGTLLTTGWVVFFHNRKHLFKRT